MVDAVEPVALAHCEPFQLGIVRIDPPHRTLIGPKGKLVVEPRIMEVLVALGRAGGEVLSRSDLIAAAWSGNVVGDNAIQRVISRIRSLAAEFADGSFSIETVRGVGYQLTQRSCVDQPPGAPAHPSIVRLPSRRAFVGALAASAVGAALWWRPWEGRPEISESARSYFNNAEAMQRSSSASNWNEQAMGLYRAAVEASPQFAEAWGGLALTLFRTMYSVRDDAVDATASRTRSAARRAINLDPDEWRANAALILVEPLFGHWQDRRARLEQLERQSGAAELRFVIGQTYLATGNFARAKPMFERLLKEDPTSLANYQVLIPIYWRTGDMAKSEALHAEASARWPRNYGLWNARFDALLLGGRTQEALRFLSEESQRPFNLAQNAIVKRRALAEKLGGGDPVAIRDLVSDFISDLGEFPMTYPRAISMLGVIGERAPFYDAFEGYFFGRGPYARNLARYSRRMTSFLYEPYFDGYRGDAQFVGLMRQMGLPSRPQF